MRFIFTSDDVGIGDDALGGHAVHLLRVPTRYHRERTTHGTVDLTDQVVCSVEEPFTLSAPSGDDHSSEGRREGRNRCTDGSSA